jgi:hypothetical protein
MSRLQQNLLECDPQSKTGAAPLPITAFIRSNVFRQPPNPASASATMGAKQAEIEDAPVAAYQIASAFIFTFPFICLRS